MRHYWILKYTKCGVDEPLTSRWLDQDFITEPLRIEGGFAYPPPGAAGLGVELDMAAVQRWSRPGAPDPARPRPPATPLPANELLARL